MVGLTSAAGLVGFLAEPDPQVQTYALARLNEDVDTLWTEVAPSISQMSVTDLAWIAYTHSDAATLFDTRASCNPMLTHLDI